LGDKGKGSILGEKGREKGGGEGEREGKVERGKR
jgi:hypothetical protein